MVKAKIKMYKLEDGKLVESPNVIRANGKVYTNPSEKILRQFGYKPLVVEPEPENLQDNQYLVEKYTETEDAIVLSWEIATEEE